MRLALVTLLVCVACRRGNEGDAPPPSGSAKPASSVTDEVLPSRPEVVQRADALAVAAVKKGGVDGARMIVEAARLRTRIWRLERREADGLEAAELLRTAAATKWEGACEAALELALLEGELRRDPTHAYRGAYLARSRDGAGECGAAAEAALTALSAFAPSREELSELDARARKASGEAPAKDAHHAEGDGPVVMPVLPQAPPRDARITNIEVYGGKDSARVVVFVTHPALFELGALAAGGGRGPRLFIDIKGVQYGGKLTLPGSGLVERVRLGKRPAATRVVLDLTGEVYRKVFYLPEPFRLVVDVSKDPPKNAAPGSEGARHVCRVVLDPGHGGHDPGATGAAGLREKDVALDIAHRAAPLIARELGISTLLTRDSDVFVPLDERVARANAFGADLFVSIHCNASENAESRGIMTFVLDSSRDDLAARVAARENSASPAAAAELATVLSRVLDPTSIARSTHFAKLLQRAAHASVTARYGDAPDLGVRSAGFYVLAGAQMPAVLFESSFISHPVEELRLDNGDYRQKLADAIVNAVRAYRDGV